MSNRTSDTEIIDIELSSYKTLGGLDRNAIVVSSSISQVLDAVRSDLSTKLDCETGEPVISGAISALSGVKTSGDVEVYGCSIKILSGNYIQTDDSSGYVQNYSAKNSFLQAECPKKYYDKYGVACTGSRGYCILSVNQAQQRIDLSGNISALCGLFEISPNIRFSVSLSSSSYSQEVGISGIYQNTLTSGYIITDVASKLKDATSAECIRAWETDDNAFYCPKRPDIGNTIIPSFYGSHAEGGSTKAIQRCTHAEGRNTIADIRYSHAEGSDTIAAEMYSHAEGNQTSALGRVSHAEGQATCAAAEGSHASGFKAYANHKGSFAWNGDSEEKYTSNGTGTFNINPIDELSGFYIGKTDLATTLNGIKTDYTGKISDALTAANGYADGAAASALNEAAADCTAKISQLKSQLVSKLTAVEDLSALSSGSSIEEVGIDAVITLRDILSSLVKILS